MKIFLMQFGGLGPLKLEAKTRFQKTAEFLQILWVNFIQPLIHTFLILHYFPPIFRAL